MASHQSTSIATIGLALIAAGVGGYLLLRGDEGEADRRDACRVVASHAPASA